MASKGVKLPVHGHTAGIYADMTVDGPQIGTLVAIFDRAKNLPNRKTLGKQNPYCAARLGKEAKKTETDLRGGQTPKWDQELRFTVHESADYYQLKVSVFNDDKKTDLIGETWIDLKNLIIPGGGQSDQWHGLQFKGKYAGELRIEMTYYDTRPEDEAVIGKRKEAAEKIHVKGNSTAANGSSLSGPRQPKPVKRRPLPEDPTSSSPAKPATSEPISPIHKPTQSRITRPVVTEHPRLSPSQAVPLESHLSPMHESRPVSRSLKDYEPPNDFHGGNALMEYSPQPSGNPIAHPTETAVQEPRMPSQGQLTEPFDPHLPQRRSQVEYDGFQEEQDRPKQRPMRDPYDYSLEMDSIYHQRDIYDLHSQPCTYHIPGPESEQGRYNIEPTTYVLQQRHSPHPYGSSPTEFIPSRSVQTQDNAFRDRSPRQSLGGEGDRPSYASMQPSVEDEQEETVRSTPPPPPVHRVAFNQANSEPESPPPSYLAYLEDYEPAMPIPQEHPVPPAPTATDLVLVRPGVLASSRMPNNQRMRSYSRDSLSNNDKLNMPLSLVPGYDATTADAEPQIHESQNSRMPTTMPSPHIQQALIQAHHLGGLPQPQYLHTSHSNPALLEEAPNSRYPSESRARSSSPDPRGIPHRKSVSPRPSSARETIMSSFPFSPDSYDALNPTTRRSKGMRNSISRYEIVERVPDVARREEITAQDDVEPIIGDDGCIIDPSDHLPSETWAPEPERKTRKPELIIRFKHSPHASAGGGRSSSRDIPTTHSPLMSQTLESGFPSAAGRAGRNHHQTHNNGYVFPHGQHQKAIVHVSRKNFAAIESDMYEEHGHTHQRHHYTPSHNALQLRRRSVSPTITPHQTSSLYAPSHISPPIPPKVPVGQPMSQLPPIRGMDALSQEMQSIDLGSVGCGPGRGARRYAPRASILTSGYAR